MSPRRLAFLVTLAALAFSGVGSLVGGQGFSLGLSWSHTPTAPPATPTLRPIPTQVAAGLLGAMPVRQAASEDAAFGRIRQITYDGCCAGAWWSPDSQSLQVIDRPDGGQAGIYALPMWPPGAEREMVDTRLNMRASGTRLLVRPAEGYSIVKDVETGLEWPLPTGGNPVRLSPDGQRAIWWEAQGGRERVDALGKIFASGIDGLDAIEIGALWGVDVIAFLPESRDVLIMGRPERDSPVYVLSRLDTETGERTELARGMWLSHVALSPGGSWVAYTHSLDTERPEDNGVWVVPTVAGKAVPHKLEVHGAYRWRDDERLVYVPMLPGMGQHALVEHEARTHASSLLFEQNAMPIQIFANDWSVAPDGSKLAFRSVDDRNIWVIQLPD